MGDQILLRRSRRPRGRWSGRAGLLVVLALAAAGCGTGDRPPAAGSSRSGQAAAPRATASGAPRPGATVEAAVATPTPSPTTTPGRSAGTAAVTLLPRRGRHLFPHWRVVADYGSSAGPALGVLGRGSPDQAARAVQKRAKAFGSSGRPVLPAMELIVTVAQGSAGHDGTYSSRGDPAAVARYLRAAHRHHMLLVLDFQPGRGEFLPQVRRYERFLVDPSVGVALDPEWKVGPRERPARVIGHARASSINAVSAYLAELVSRRRLPDKLFVIHQFTPSMLPDRRRILVRPGLATVLHADGNGSPAQKASVYRGLRFRPPFAAGFKLFLTKDTRLMRPHEVMALRPRPDLVTYQ